MTLHRIWGSAQPYPQTAPTDGDPFIRLAAIFYMTAGQTWGCVGGRVHIPSSGPLSSGIRIMAWTGVHETPIELGDAPLRSVETVTPSSAGWAEVSWAPFDVIGGTTAVAIGYEFTAAPATYLFTSLADVGTPFVQAADGSPLYLAESGYTGGRGRFKIGAGASATSSGNWYGADIVMDDGETTEPEPLVAGMLVGGVWRQGVLYAGQQPNPVTGAAKT